MNSDRTDSTKYTQALLDATKQHRAPHFLFIEDDLSMQAVLPRLLERKTGARVTVLNDHEEAREWLAANPRPDLVITDNDTLDGNDGLKWVAELVEQGSCLPVIMMTGGDGYFTAKDMAEAGHPNLKAALNEKGAATLLPVLEKVMREEGITQPKESGKAL